MHKLFSAGPPGGKKEGWVPTPQKVERKKD